MYVVKETWVNEYAGRREKEFEYLSGYYTSKKEALPFIQKYRERYASFFGDTEVKTEFIEITNGRYFSVLVNYTDSRLDDFLGVFDGQDVIDFLEKKGYSPNRKTDIYVIPITIGKEFKGYTNSF